VSELSTPFWVVWKNRRGKAKGVAIVFRASDYALELQPNGLSEDDRLAACERLAKQLNEAKVRI
jgi:hypothetical protein